VPWLVERGMKEANARSLLGGAVKAMGEEGAWKLASECMEKKPLDPAQWLSAAINKHIKANGMAKVGDKFAVAGLDHSSSRAAAEASMRKHGIVVPDNDEIPL
jgi:hypothetical protein